MGKVCPCRRYRASRLNLKEYEFELTQTDSAILETGLKPISFSLMNPLAQFVLVLWSMLLMVSTLLGWNLVSLQSTWQYPGRHEIDSEGTTSVIGIAVCIFG